MGDLGLIPRLGRSPGEGKSYPFKCSGLEHYLDCIVHGVSKSRTRLRLQQYVNHELPDVQAGFRKGRGTRDQIANTHWIVEKAREFQKNIYCSIDYTKAFDCVDHNKLWKILKEMGILDYLTCLLKLGGRSRSIN